MKNICFFSGDITRSGGTERVGSVIANRLAKNEEYNICFLSLWEKHQKSFYDIEKNIKRYKLFENEVSGKKILSYIKGIRRFVKSRKIDLLIDIDGILDLYSIPALWGTKAKLISWEQFNFYQNPDGNYRKITRKWAAKRADAIVVLTDEDKGYYEQELKIRGKLQRIYNPIEQGEQNKDYKYESKTMISAGRLTHQKDFDLLLDIAQKVFENHSDWQWIICGEGEDRKSLESKIQQYHLDKNVILKGNVKNIDEYYKQSAMFILTSRFEGFGLVLTEAKKMGLPCISFRCPAGPSEIIEDGVNGYLVDCFDIQAMADRINMLIEDDEKRVSFSNNALVGTDKFNIDNIANQWKKLIEELY